MLREVTVENGRLRGLPAADPRITAFKGIPFAAPPTGSRRWQAPQPVAAWSGVYEAYQFAPASLQAPIASGEDNIYNKEWHVDPDLPMAEDCLYLNVWTPARRTDEKLPVYVWFFGGGFMVGYTPEMEFDGERLARRGLVVVTVNYRLNVFGFLCHPELSRDNPAQPANFGLLDQQFALAWVRRNIAAFGGDADNVTIGGQSAGGMSVLCQMCGRANEGLFQRAIIQSGLFTPVYPGERGIRTPELAQAEEQGQAFFDFLGVSSLAEARRIDALELRDKMLAFGRSWGPVVDGQFLPELPYTMLRERRCLNVPLLTGYTANEFFSSLRAEDEAALAARARQLFGERADEFWVICRREEGAPELSEGAACGRVRVIEYAIRAALNARAGTSPGDYFYMFDVEIPGPDRPGAFHSSDLWFTFETLAKCWRPFTGKHYDMARLICNYWANFIASGNPNGRDADGSAMPVWEPYSLAEPYAMYFEDQAHFKRAKPSALMTFLLEQRAGQKKPEA